MDEKNTLERFLSVCKNSLMMPILVHINCKRQIHMYVVRVLRSKHLQRNNNTKKYQPIFQSSFASAHPPIDIRLRRPNARCERINYHNDDTKRITHDFYIYIELIMKHFILPHRTTASRRIRKSAVEKNAPHSKKSEMRMCCYCCYSYC